MPSTAWPSAYEQRADYERALRHAWRQVELEPWREAAHRQVMRLLALSDQRVAALAQFETCRRLLADELGVEPEAETAALYEQIRGGAFPGGAAARPACLPHSTRRCGCTTCRSRSRPWWDGRRSWPRSSVTWAIPPAGC